MARRQRFDEEADDEGQEGKRFDMALDTLRERIAKLVQSSARAGEELDLHGLLLDAIPFPVRIAAADGKCVFFNDSWLKFTGRTMEQELGNGWAEGVHPDDRERVLADNREAMLKCRAFSAEYRLRRHDGRYRNVVDLGQPFFDRGSGQTAYVESVFDFTERVEAETRLAKAKARAEMYLDLMCHDINNLNQIGIGYLEIVMGSPDIPDAERHLLERPLETLRSSSELIENVRKLQDLNESCPRRRQLDICTMLERLRDQYPRPPEREVSISIRPSTCCTVIGNELLRDVFENVVGNAIRHSDPSRPLEIDTRADSHLEDGKEYCSVTFEDNGPGISDEVKARLFRHPRRGDGGTGGHGLGLYLVRALVESFGGHVRIEDRVPGEYDRGIRLVITLPSIE